MFHVTFPVDFFFDLFDFYAKLTAKRGYEPAVRNRNFENKSGVVLAKTVRKTVEIVRRTKYTLDRRNTVTL